MTQSYVSTRGLAASLVRLARIKASISQRELAEKASVPVTMVSAYERGKREPTLPTLTRLIKAAGFDLRLHLVTYDDHDDILAKLESTYSKARKSRGDKAIEMWRQARPVEK